MLLAFFFFFFFFSPPQISVGFAVDPNVIKKIFFFFFSEEKKERKGKKATHDLKNKQTKQKTRHLMFSHSHSSVSRSTGAVGTFSLSFFSPPLY